MSVLCALCSVCVRVTIAGGGEQGDADSEWLRALRLRERPRVITATSYGYEQVWVVPYRSSCIYCIDRPCGLSGEETSPGPTRRQGYLKPQLVPQVKVDAALACARFADWGSREMVARRMLEKWWWERDRTTVLSRVILSACCYVLLC